MALLHVEFGSKVLGMASSMDVILPQRDLSSEKADEENDSLDFRYPVLYLLHGMSDNHTIWQRRTAIELYAAGYKLAIVMPDAHLSWYTDMAHGLKYCTFFSEELPAVCHELFPRISTRREDTFIGGVSMGGYGAMKIGLGNPDRFSKVVSLSGALDMRAGLNDGRKGQYWEDVFGPHDSFAGSDNDLLAVAERLAASGREKPRIYMWCGFSDFLYQQNLTMKAKLESLHYDLTYEESEGNHGWVWWDPKTVDVLKWLFADRSVQ